MNWRRRQLHGSLRRDLTSCRGLVKPQFWLEEGRPQREETRRRPEEAER